MNGSTGSEAPGPTGIYRCASRSGSHPRDAPPGHQVSLRTEGRPRTGTEGRVAPSASVCHAAGWGISRSPLRTLVNSARPTRSFLPHP